jgi:hypothetical protein
VFIKTKFNIAYIQAFFVSLMGLFTNTIGFDFYFHAISSSSLDTISMYNPVWSIYEVRIPRYLFLQLYIWFFSFGIFPSAIILTFFNSIILYKSYQILRNSNRLLLIASAFFLLLQIIYFSGTGFSISLIFLSFVCYFISKRKKQAFIFMFLGMSVHPVGFVIGTLIGFVFFSERIRLVLMSILILSLAIGAQFLIDIFYYDQALREFDLERFTKLMTKWPEFLAILTALLLVIGSFKFQFNKKRRFKGKHQKNAYEMRVSVFFSVIFVLLAVALHRAIPAHFNTMGPAKLLFLLDGSELNDERVEVSIITGTWVSPLLYKQELLENQYKYRK